MAELKLEDFFKEEYIDFSVYDNVRKLSSYIDGQKNASRKIVHTVLQQNIDKFVKVSNLGPKVQDYAQYLHGSLEGTIVNMTADYVGSGNNVPLLEGDGNFGSAFINEAAATRYIFARMNPTLKQLFVKDDFVNLQHQDFEGAKIEPRFYVPTLPMLAINGSDGVSIGYAQKILPRDPAQIVKWVQQRAEGAKITARLTPYWKGMKCKVVKGESDGQWEVHGAFTRKTKHRITIDALPVGYTLKQYQAVLEKLVDDKVIKDYEDFSDNDVFEFEIQVDRSFGERTDEWIMTKLKLIKKITENYTCIDENNKIVIFNSMKELLEAWYNKRIEYNNLRKKHLLASLQEEMDYTNARAKFIQGVVEEAIELRNTKESDVIAQGEAYDVILKDRVKGFLGLPMRSLTTEEIAKLRSKAKALKSEIKEYSKKTFETILLEDINTIKL
jgi:DNA topoisomerase-2